jgi:3-hydroxyisobutyrate dehydrogenase
MGERLGFIGLGRIGLPMAQRLLAAGHPLTVFNRTAEKAAPLVEAGASRADDIAALVRAADVVFLCLSDTAAVEEVAFGPGGIAGVAKPGQLVVDLSTIHPLRTRELAARLREETGAGWVDAPVSGGPAGARAGTLAVMAGGTAEDVERVRPLLMAFAGRVTHMGPAGSGMAMKACNQMLSFGSGAVIAETLNLAARFGIDPALVPEAVAGGFADSNVLRHYAPQMIEGRYAGSGRTGMKDLDIALDLARLTGSAVPMTSLVASMFRLVLAQGFEQGGLATPMRLYAQGPLKASDNGDGKE